MFRYMQCYSLMSAVLATVPVIGMEENKKVQKVKDLPEGELRTNEPTCSMVGGKGGKVIGRQRQRVRMAATELMVEPGCGRCVKCCHRHMGVLEELKPSLHMV